MLKRVWAATPWIVKAPVRRVARLVLSDARRRRVVAGLRTPQADSRVSELLGVDVLSVDAFELPVVFDRLEKVVARTSMPTDLRQLSKYLRSQGWHRSSLNALTRLKEVQNGALTPELAVDEAESLAMLGDRRTDDAIRSLFATGPEALGLKATKRLLSIAYRQMTLAEQQLGGEVDFLEASCQAFPFDAETVVRSEQLRARLLNPTQEALPLPRRLDESIDDVLKATEVPVRTALSFSHLLEQYESADRRVLQLRQAALRNALLKRDLASALVVVPHLQKLRQTEIEKLHTLINNCKNLKVLAGAAKGNDGRGRGVAPDVAAILDAAAQRARSSLSDTDEKQAAELTPVVANLLKKEAALAIEMARRIPVSGMSRSIAVAHLLGRALSGRAAEAHPALRRIALENPSDDMVWSILRFAAVRAHGPTDADIALYGSLEMRRPIPGWISTARQHRGEHARPDGYHAQADAVIQRLAELSGTRFFARTERPGLEHLTGASVLLLSDNGVSDEIRFSQDLRELQSVAKKVTATCDPRAVGLLSRGFPRVEFVPFRRHALIETGDGRAQSGINAASESRFVPRAMSDMSDFDIVMTQGTLGDMRLVERLWGTQQGDDYLVPDPSAFDTRQVEALPGLKVGLQWRSGSMHGLRPFVYPPLAALVPVLAVAGASFVNLQHMLTEQERGILERFGVTMLELDLYEDFEGIATVAESLDLVIGTSSLPIELAAAVGTEVWMLGFNPENYYLRTRGGTTENDILTWNSTIIGPENPREAFLAGDDVSLAMTVERVRERLEVRVAREKE